MENKTSNLPKNEMEQSSQLSSIIKNGILFKNPVLYSALGLCPVVAAGLTLHDGLALSLLLACLLIPTCLIASIFGTRIPAAARPPVYLLLSAACYFPASTIVESVFPKTLLNVGVFAPLMVINAIILRRADTFAAKHIVFAAVIDSIACSIGFGLVMCISSGLREILTLGTLSGYHIFFRRLAVPSVVLPCIGFVLLGFFAAFVQALRNRRDRVQRRKEKERS